MDFHLPVCGGCKTCELACSYHHNKAFTYEGGCFELIERDDRNGFTLRIHETAKNGRPACDGCKGLEQPLCLRYCVEIDDMYPLVKDFFEQQAAKEQEGV